MESTAKVCDYHPVFVASAQPILSLFASGKVKPIIYPTVYPLEKAMEGLDAVQRRETWGKAVVRVRDEDGKAIIGAKL